MKRAAPELEDFDTLDTVPGVELVFGLVAPIGVDLDIIEEQLELALRSVKYDSVRFKITDQLQELDNNFSADKINNLDAYIDKYKEKINRSNDLRSRYGNNILAKLAILGIRYMRHKYNIKHKEEISDNLKIYNFLHGHEEGAYYYPYFDMAFIVRQIKRPEEVELFRKTYGKQFILVGVHAPKHLRRKYLVDNHIKSSGGLIEKSHAENEANSLIEQDSKESSNPSGQNVRDAYQLSDVFIDGSDRYVSKKQIERFINLLFGNNFISPSKDEYGMYMCKAASLRSSDLSRQVGCSIFDSEGSIVSLGYNEVPKSGGGVYVDGDKNDAREIIKGFDSNEDRKNRLLIDITERFRLAGVLNESYSSEDGSIKIIQRLFRDEIGGVIKTSSIMDIIEFGRVVHAEMNALSDAARYGKAVNNCCMYVTTFPCHLCAKHIIASGINRVVYLEPYPKSHALDLHNDSMAVDEQDAMGKVKFESFVGISPYRYRDLFEKKSRKDDEGKAQEWNFGIPKPMIDIGMPTYYLSEALIAYSVAKIFQNTE